MIRSNWRVLAAAIFARLLVFLVDMWSDDVCLVLQYV